jgi:hypothetical protein
VLPLFLYNGVIFDARQVSGGLLSIADLFKNSVTDLIPSVPKCFNSCSGILLSPLLLLALKLSFNADFNSSSYM